MADELVCRYPGKYVAFVDGAFQGADSDREALLEQVYREHGLVEVFVQPVEGYAVRHARTPFRSR